ncbi:MAG TPA: hypothetical protein VMH22_03600 [bacterium]|nr:hypothetical protein [bacterium]
MSTPSPTTIGDIVSATALRSLSQGRASNSMQFSHFSAVDQSTRERLYPLFAGHPQ